MKLSLRRCWPHTQPGLRRCHGNRQGLDPSQKAPDLDLAPQRGWQARAGWGWSLKSGSHAGRPVGGPCSQMASEVTHRAGLSPGCHGHRLPGPSPPPIPQGLRCVLPRSHVACLGRWREQGARARALGLLFLALPPFTTCVTLGQSLSLSEPEFFFFLQSEAEHQVVSPPAPGMCMVSICSYIIAQYMAQGQVYSRCSINGADSGRQAGCL